jgi:hypothetical protein
MFPVPSSSPEIPSRYVFVGSLIRFDFDLAAIEMFTANCSKVTTGYNIPLNNGGIPIWAIFEYAEM